MAELSNIPLFNDANLKSYYKLEDTADSKGAITLTNNNTVTFTAGKYTNGANFGASNTNKSLSNTTNNPFGIGSGAFSISMWVKVLTEPSGAAYRLFDTASTTTQVTLRIEYIDSAGTKTITTHRLRNGVADVTLSFNTALGTSNFHHLVYLYDTTNVSLYLDGILVAGPTAASGDGSVGATAGVFMGTAPDLSGDPASVIIDDVGVFTRALTLSEILNIYNEGGSGLISKIW